MKDDKKITWEELMKDVDMELDNYDTNNLDTKICIGLAQGDGWWGNMLSYGVYTTLSEDLASDYHDYCHLNALDQHEVQSAVSFLKQVKMEQKLKKIEGDFND